MTYTLWRSSELLGEGELRPVPAAAGALAGPFRPTPGFAAVWPAFRAAQAARASMLHALAALPLGAGPDEIRARLVESDPAGAVGVARASVEALGLEVRDAAGHALAGVQADVSSWAVPGLDDLTPEERLAAERDAATAGVVLSGDNYVLSLTPRSPGPATAGADGSAGAS